MAIIMGKGCIEAIYGLMGWKGLIMFGQLITELLPDCLKVMLLALCFMPQGLCPCL